ncbi:AIPR family protein [Spiroplasma endosymbiont of Panorpa germanica]|uniref:AIPR family protein n=1 Tax=Spiroplasma endosymbiont of Panorpa germanica TaxID=3066314 RepID=UPI0030CB27B9
MNKEIEDFINNLDEYEKLCVKTHYNFSSGADFEETKKWYFENSEFISKINLPNIGERIEDEEYMFATVFEDGFTSEQKIDKIMKLKIAIKNFKDGLIDEKKYSQSFLEVIDSLKEAEQPKITIIIFFNETLRDNEIKEMIFKLDKVLDENVSIEIFDLKRFEINLALKDYNIKESSSEVKDFDFKFQNKNNYNKNDGNNNIIKYSSSDEEGIVMSIEAHSLAMAYEKFKNRLFDYNVRYSISNGKANSQVDREIKDTILKQRDKFWIFNNGITIVSNDFDDPDFFSNKIHLKGFSIVNGAQTVTNLYNFWRGSQDKNILKDVYVLAKIIKPKKENSGNLISVIETITKAANNQKPIKARDFKSNSKEMRELKDFLKWRGIILNIKRGDADFKDKEDKEDIINLEKFKKEEIITINNEVLGQRVMALLLGKPWKALQNKSKIFEDEKIYKEIFQNKNLNELDFYSIINFFDVSKEKLESCFKYNINIESFKEKLEINDISSIMRSTIWWIISALWMVASNRDKIEDLLRSGDFKEYIYKNSEIKNVNFDLNKDDKEFDENLTYYLQDCLNALVESYNMAAREVKDSKTKKTTIISNSAFSFREIYFDKFIEKLFSVETKFDIGKKAERLKKLFVEI